jgi:hypothetical protein
LNPWFQSLERGKGYIEIQIALETVLSGALASNRRYFFELY